MSFSLFFKILSPLAHHLIKGLYGLYHHFRICFGNALQIRCQTGKIILVIFFRQLSSLFGQGNIGDPTVFRRIGFPQIPLLFHFFYCPCHAGTGDIQIVTDI